MRIEYIPNDGPKPFRIWISGHEFKVTLRGLGLLTDAAQTAFEQYALDRGGVDPRSNPHDWKQEIDEL